MNSYFDHASDDLLNNLRKLATTTKYDDALMLKAFLCLPELRTRLANKTSQNDSDWLATSIASTLSIPDQFNGIWATSVLKIDSELKAFDKGIEAELLAPRKQLAAGLLPL